MYLFCYASEELYIGYRAQIKGINPGHTIHVSCKPISLPPRCGYAAVRDGNLKTMSEHTNFFFPFLDIPLIIKGTAGSVVRKDPPNQDKYMLLVEKLDYPDWFSEWFDLPHISLNTNQIYITPGTEVILERPFFHQYLRGIFVPGQEIDFAKWRERVYGPMGGEIYNQLHQKKDELKDTKQERMKWQRRAETAEESCASLTSGAEGRDNSIQTLRKRLFKKDELLQKTQAEMGALRIEKDQLLQEKDARLKSMAAELKKMQLAMDALKRDNERLQKQSLGQEPIESLPESLQEQQLSPSLPDSAALDITDLVSDPSAAPDTTVTETQIVSVVEQTAPQGASASIECSQEPHRAKAKDALEERFEEGIPAVYPQAELRATSREQIPQEPASNPASDHKSKHESTHDLKSGRTYILKAKESSSSDDERGDDEVQKHTRRDQKPSQLNQAEQRGNPHPNSKKGRKNKGGGKGVEPERTGLANQADQTDAAVLLAKEEMTCARTFIRDRIDEIKKKKTLLPKVNPKAQSRLKSEMMETEKKIEEKAKELFARHPQNYEPLMSMIFEKSLTKLGIRLCEYEASRGNIAAKHDLALAYKDNAKKNPEDYAKAIKIWEELSEMGDPTALFNLGLEYNDRLNRPKEAYQLFLEAKQKGSVEAAQALAKIEDGRAAEARTTKIWEELAEKDDIVGLYELGIRYCRTPGRQEEGYALLVRARNKGSAKAPEALAKIELSRDVVKPTDAELANPNIPQHVKQLIQAKSAEQWIEMMSLFHVALRQDPITLGAMHNFTLTKNIRYILELKQAILGSYFNHREA